jgi:hypothetical protein
MNIKNAFIVICTLLLFIVKQGSTQIYKDTIHAKNIKTVLLHRKGSRLSYPLFRINSNDKLVLTFDDLDAEVKGYTYSIIHCNYNWTPSSIISSEYIAGFQENPVEDYSYSNNTTQDYVSYRLEIPNNDVQLKLSGNYIIKVYPDYDIDKPVFTRRFWVYEEKSKIKIDIHRATIAAYIDEMQEIDFTVDYYVPEISYPSSEIKVVLARNNVWSTAIKDLTPKYINGNHLDYNYNEKNVMYGLNEYRFFNCKDINHASINISNIDFKRPYYHFYLEKDFVRYNYVDDQDVNGQFYVQYEDEEESRLLADYIYVHFYLPMDAPIINSDIYVYGNHNLWNFEDQNKMTYNYNTMQYEATMQLKQGFYNYHYAVLPDNSSTPDVKRIESSHWQTENDYLVFVYACPTTLRYHKLIGVKMVNTGVVFR